MHTNDRTIQILGAACINPSSRGVGVQQFPPNSFRHGAQKCVEKG